MGVAEEMIETKMQNPSQGYAASLKTRSAAVEQQRTRSAKQRKRKNGVLHSLAMRALGKHYSSIMD